MTLFIRSYLLLLIGFYGVSSPLTAAEMLWLADAKITHPDPAKNIALDVNGSTFDVLRAGLPDLLISTLVVNTSRAMIMLKNEPNACAGNKLLSPQRLEVSIASRLPQVVFPGYRLFALEGSATARMLKALQNEQGSVSLRRLLQEHSSSRLAVIGGRSYGAELDKLIHDPELQTQLWQRHASDLAGGVIEMLAEGRIELMIDYPNVVQHYLRNRSKPVHFFSVPMAESPRILLGHIICSKSAEGQQLLVQLDQQLATASQQPEFLKAHLMWFDPASHAEVTALYNEVYGTKF